MNIINSTLMVIASFGVPLFIYDERAFTYYSAIAVLLTILTTIYAVVYLVYAADLPADLRKSFWRSVFITGYFVCVVSIIFIFKESVIPGFI